MSTSIDVFAKVHGHDREEILSAAREVGLIPYFRTVESPAMPVVEMEGQPRIMLASNNYLGLTGDERVMQGAEEALHRYGTGLTGSRLMNGTTPLHLELEQEIAEWIQTEDALVFTTGHQANVGTLGTLLGPGDTVIVDSADHASILDGVLLSRAKMRPFRHGRLDKLERALQRAQDDGGGALVVVDGVFSMEGDVAPLVDITELCGRHGARLMVDEAHGAGVLGRARSRSVRAAGRRGSRRPAHGYLLQVAGRLRRLRRRTGGRDRLPAHLLARLPVHGLGGPGGARRGPRGAADRALRRGPAAAVRGARARALLRRGPAGARLHAC